LSTPSRTAGRRWPIALAAALVALTAGSLVVAMFSLRSIEGAVPGTSAILGLATNGAAFLVGTGDGAYTSRDGRRWARVEGIEGRTLVTGSGDGAVVLNGSALYTSGDLATLAPLAGDVPEASALAAGPSGEVYLATRESRFFKKTGEEPLEKLPEAEGPEDPLALAAGPNTPPIVGAPPVLMAGGLSSGLWRSADEGARWSKILGTPTRAVMIDQRTAGRTYLATAGGILVSSDARTWEFTDLREPVETLAQTAESYYAVTAARLLYASPDGQKWSALALDE
jgi:hypothetical protein